VHVLDTTPGKQSYAIMQAGEGGERSRGLSEVSIQPAVVHSKDLILCLACCFWGVEPPCCLMSTSWATVRGWEALGWWSESTKPMQEQEGIRLEVSRAHFPWICTPAGNLLPKVAFWVMLTHPKAVREGFLGYAGRVLLTWVA